MGGPYSGRWGLHTKATTVQECRELDLRELARKGALTPWYAGTVHWLRGERETASIGYAVYPGPALDGSLVLVLQYEMTQTGEAVKLRIPLETTRPHFGGQRWWGRCPLVVDGRACHRRVAKLYLPPGGQYFGCRHCYRLTYESCQEHDKRVDRLLQDPGGPEAVLRQALAEKNPGKKSSKLHLFLKADRLALKRWRT